MKTCTYFGFGGEYEAECNGKIFSSAELAVMMEQNTRLVVHPKFGHLKVSICPFCYKELTTAR